MRCDVMWMGTCGSTVYLNLYEVVAKCMAQYRRANSSDKTQKST